MANAAIVQSIHLIIYRQSLLLHASIPPLFNK